MHFVVSCDEVLTRLSALLNTKTDGELAAKMGVAAQTVSTWRGRNRVPYEHLVDICLKNKVSLDYLVFGKGKQSNSQTEGQIDLELFNQVNEAINSPDSELCGIGFEHPTEQVIAVYNSVIQCETESEKQRMIKAQAAILHQFASEYVKKIPNLESLLSADSTNEAEEYSPHINAPDSVSKGGVTQNISGHSNQIAGRDLVNKGKS